MFRENVLTKDDVINRISKAMVPVAVNYESVQKGNSPEARFVRRLLGAEGDRQGVYIFSPSGKMLASGVSFGDMRAKTHRMIDKALGSFGSFQPRSVEKIQLNPYRGKGIRPDGSVRLAEYVRRLDKSNISSPVISSVVMSEDEFRTFAPLKAVKDAQWSIPIPIAKKLCRVASPMCYQHAPQPSWVTGVTLKGAVESVQDGKIRISYTGKLAAQRVIRGSAFSRQEVALRGEGIYDSGDGRMQELLIVGSGQIRWLQEDTPPAAFNALVEWKRK